MILTTSTRSLKRGSFVSGYHRQLAGQELRKPMEALQLAARELAAWRNGENEISRAADVWKFDARVSNISVFSVSPSPN